MNFSSPPTRSLIILSTWAFFKNDPSIFLCTLSVYWESEKKTVVLYVNRSAHNAQAFSRFGRRDCAKEGRVEREGMASGLCVAHETVVGQLTHGADEGGEG